MITKLKPGNSQFPGDKVVGDVVVLSNGDIFCYDGAIWQLLGGRYIPAGMREAFLGYLQDGWPDHDSAIFDLETIIKLEIFLPEEEIEPDTLNLEMTKRAVKRFKERVLEVCKRCEKFLLNQS